MFFLLASVFSSVMSVDRRFQQPVQSRHLPNVQKLEAYSDTMVACAESRMKEGKMNEAASYFLKAADILLYL